MNKATLIRHYKPDCTTGFLTVYDKDKEVFKCRTLEPPNINNQQNISCIPIGDYHLIPHISPKFGKCLKIIDVVGRSNILIHAGNTKKDTTGCILVGKNIDEINFLLTSKVTLNALLECSVLQTLLIIR